MEEFIGGHLWILHEHGKCCLHWYNDDKQTAYITSLHVVFEYRKQGIGTKLINDAINEAKKRGYKFACLKAFNKSWIIKWYRRLGFKELCIDNDDQDYTWLRINIL